MEHVGLQQHVAEIVRDMAPKQGALGILTDADVRQIIERAAARGVMVGWTAGMRQARSILAETLEKT
jgi:hypothetical protein